MSLIYFKISSYWFHQEGTLLFPDKILILRGDSDLVRRKVIGANLLLVVIYINREGFNSIFLLLNCPSIIFISSHLHIFVDRCWHYIFIRISYHLFHWFATLENKTPTKRFQNVCQSCVVSMSSYRAVIGGFWADLSTTCKTIVNRGDWLWSPANIKGANKDAKIYVGKSTTLHNLLFSLILMRQLRNQHVSIG